VASTHSTNQSAISVLAGIIAGNVLSMIVSLIDIRGGCCIIVVLSKVAESLGYFSLPKSTLNLTGNVNGYPSLS